jgi:hypothetical protein
MPTNVNGARAVGLHGIVLKNIEDLEAELCRYPELAEILKQKQWLTSHHFDDSLLTSPDLIPHLVDAAKAMMPFSHWCNKSFEL